MEVQTGSLPASALLRRYDQPHGYVDCYTTSIPGTVAFERYVIAFYTTPLFRLERWILRWIAARPSEDADIERLLADERSTFAAWRLEAREEHQLLLCDYLGRTRSWLHSTSEQGNSTRLYFGSAIVPETDPETGDSRLGTVFRLLLGFHRLYSRLLLASARRRLQIR